MQQDLEKYLRRNQPIEIIYIDQNGKTSQRTLRLHSITGRQVKAYCFNRQAYRVFIIDNILAAVPVSVRQAG